MKSPLAQCFCFHPCCPFCKNTKLQARNREKRSGIFGVCWLNFTSARFTCFFLLWQGRQKLGVSLAALNQKAVNIVLLFWKKVWMNEKHEKKGWQKCFFWFKFVSREEMGFWLRTLPEVQGLHTETFPSVVWFPLHPRQQDLCALLQTCLNPLPISACNIQWVLYFGWLFYITSFAHSLWMFHWRGVRVSKKTIYSLFSLGPEAWDAGPLWGAPAVPKSTAYTWEKVLILHEAQSLSEALHSLHFEGCSLF